MRSRWLHVGILGAVLIAATTFAMWPRGPAFVVHLEWREGAGEGPIDGEITLTWHLGPRYGSEVRQRVHVDDGIARTRIPYVHNEVGANWYLYLRVSEVELQSSPARAVTESQSILANVPGASFELRRHDPDAGLADAGTRTWLHVAVAGLRHEARELDDAAQERLARYLRNASADDGANVDDAEFLDLLIGAAWLGTDRGVRLDPALLESALPRAAAKDATTTLRCLPFLCAWPVPLDAHVVSMPTNPPAIVDWLTRRTAALDWPHRRLDPWERAQLSSFAQVRYAAARERLLIWRRWHDQPITPSEREQLAACWIENRTQRQFEPSRSERTTIWNACLHGLQFELARLDAPEKQLGDHRTARERDRRLARAMGPCATQASLCSAADLARFATTPIDELAARYWTSEDPDLFRLVEALWLSGDPTCVSALAPALRER